MRVSIANSEDPDQTVSSEAVGSGSALNCPSIFGRHPVFEISEHLL